jgi:hypothetical protein
MSRIRMAVAALLMTLSGGAFAAGPLPIPIPTLPGLSLVQILPTGGLGGLGGVPLLNIVLPGGVPGAPAPVAALLGTLTNALSPYANQLPLVGLVQIGDPFLRPIITPLSDVVYIPVLGAAFGNN